jgi:NADH:ubiquinone oxidoreductase subunit 5 (subunit L)/multisubunit Na+/H+ antiporter MnhA subunit
MGGLFHMLNHAVYKSCLFMGAGVVEREAGTTRLDRLGGLAKGMPVTMGAMLVAALAISGIPPLNGFVSKWMVYQGCVAAGRPIFLVVALFGSVLTLASFVKVLHSVFWGPCPAALAGVRESGIALRLPLVTLAALCVLLGVFAGYALDGAIGPAVGLELGAAVSGADVLAGAPATWSAAGSAAASGAGGPPRASFRPVAVTGLLIAGILAGLLLVYAGRSPVRRTRSVFIGGEPLDPEVNRFPGTEFYRTVAELPGLRPALDAGNRGALDPYCFLERFGGGLVRLLRRLHTGVVTDYLVWCLLGLGAVLSVLFWS